MKLSASKSEIQIEWDSPAYAGAEHITQYVVEWSMG
jgi:hypothetical protein